MMYTGLYTALITPFNEEGALDKEGLTHLIERQLLSGTDGLVVLGSTGEAPTLTHEEKISLIKIAREAWPKKTLFVGTGAYSTALTIRNTQEAEELGADGALIVSPYYNKPSQEGLYLHFKAVAEACSLPILLYNTSSRTGVEQQLETILRLSDIENICGIKDCNFSHIAPLIYECKKREKDFSIFTGDDEYTFPTLALGGQGVISILGNLLPVEMKAIVELAESGEWEEAREIYYLLTPLFQALQIDTNPMIIKAAMEWLGLPAGKPRLPLTTLSENNNSELKKILEQFYEEKTATCPS